MRREEETNDGAVSATMTVYFLLCAAVLRKASTVFDIPRVNIISLGNVSIFYEDISLEALTRSGCDLLRFLKCCRKRFLARLERLVLLP